MVEIKDIELKNEIQKAIENDHKSASKPGNMLKEMGAKINKVEVFVDLEVYYLKVTLHFITGKVPPREITDRWTSMWYFKIDNKMTDTHKLKGKVGQSVMGMVGEFAISGPGYWNTILGRPLTDRIIAMSKQNIVEKTASITERLDVIASEFELIDPRIALALDIISDKLEKMASGSVKDLYEFTKEINPKHAETLIGERQKGSKWGESLTEKKLTSLPWKEYKGPKIPGVMMPICDYYKIEDAGKHFPGAKQRMETLDVAEKKGYKLKVETGEHGNKQIVSPDVKEAPIIEAWLVVGPAEDGEGKEVAGKKMIWTLFPGVLTGSDPKWDGKIESIPESQKKHTAVKGI